MTTILRPLFSYWDVVAPRLASTRMIGLFLDFDGRAAAERVHWAVDPWRSRLRVSPDESVLDVSPIDFADKGAAVRREMASLPARALPVYVGDDISDESGFAAAHHGIAIRVGALRNTRARYRLDGDEQVGYFLERLRTEFL